jgi:DNA-binding NarL/FixJ family response regulator
MPSLVLADDHPLMLRGIQDLLAAAPDIEILGAATSGGGALSMIRDRSPDIALLDISMPGMGGPEVQAELARSDPSVKVIFLTATLSSKQVNDAVELGVWGLLLKEDAPETLLDCVRSVDDNRRWLPREVMARVTSRPAPADALSSLTRREREIADLVCDGLSNRRIADHLQMSEGTVGIHLQNIYRKLEINNRTMLAALRLQRHRGADA